MSKNKRRRVQRRSTGPYTILDYQIDIVRTLFHTPKNRKSRRRCGKEYKEYAESWKNSEVKKKPEELIKKFKHEFLVTGIKYLLMCIKSSEIRRIWKKYFEGKEFPTKKGGPDLDAATTSMYEKFHEMNPGTSQFFKEREIKEKVENEGYVFSNYELTSFGKNESVIFFAEKPMIKNVHLPYDMMERIFEYFGGSDNDILLKYGLVNKYFYKFAINNLPNLVLTSKRIRKRVRSFIYENTKNIYFTDKNPLYSMMGLVPRPTMTEDDYYKSLRKIQRNPNLRKLSFLNCSEDSFVRTVYALTNSRFQFRATELYLPNETFNRNNTLIHKIGSFNLKNFRNLRILATPVPIVGLNELPALEEIQFQRNNKMLESLDNKNQYKSFSFLNFDEKYQEEIFKFPNLKKLNLRKVTTNRFSHVKGIIKIDEDDINKLSKLEVFETDLLPTISSIQNFLYHETLSNIVVVGDCELIKKSLEFVFISDNNKNVLLSRPKFRVHNKPVVLDFRLGNSRKLILHLEQQMVTVVSVGASKDVKDLIRNSRFSSFSFLDYKVIEKEL